MGSHLRYTLQTQGLNQPWQNEQMLNVKMAIRAAPLHTMRATIRVRYPTRSMTLNEHAAKTHQYFIQETYLGWYLLPMVLWKFWVPFKITFINMLLIILNYGMTVFGFSLVAMVMDRVPTNIIFYGTPTPYLCTCKSVQIQASTLDNSPHVKNSIGPEGEYYMFPVAQPTLQNEAYPKNILFLFW